MHILGSGPFSLQGACQGYGSQVFSENAAIRTETQSVIISSTVPVLAQIRDTDSWFQGI